MGKRVIMWQLGLSFIIKIFEIVAQFLPWDEWFKKPVDTLSADECIQALESLATMRFVNLEREMDMARANLAKVFFVDYMIKDFVAFARKVKKDFKSTKKLPDFSHDTLWNIIYVYRARAISEWESSWKNNPAMRIFVEKIDNVRHQIVDKTYRDIELVCASSMTDKQKFDLSFQILKETFTASFFGIHQVIKELNGELSESLNAWKEIQIKRLLTPSDK